jgi:C4-dicarboxylate-specific signal transduction histidine kinase
MDAIFWVALAFFLAAGSFGLVLVGLRAWRAWQAFVSLAAAGAAASERLAAATEQLQARSEAAATRIEELNAAVARLRRTQARLRILLGAWGEVTGLLVAARMLSPR